MTSITLTHGWFNLAADPDQSVNLIIDGTTETEARPVEHERYSQGRLRSFSRVGTAKVMRLRFDQADRDDIDMLRTWVGELVMYRDPLARKFWGTFDDLSIVEIPGTNGTFADVALTFVETTFSEVV